MPRVVSMCFAALAAGFSTAAATAQMPWPPAYVPPGNPSTPEKVVLGKILYWEEQLSSDDSVACGTCHAPEAGGGDPRVGNWTHPGPDGVYGTGDDRFASPGLVRQTPSLDFTPDPIFGLDYQVGPRTAPGNLGAIYHSELFWDGRARGAFLDPETNQVALAYGGALEIQATAPILNPAEMAHEGRTWADVRAKLQRVRPLALASNPTPDIVQALQQHPTYPDLFAAAFGDPSITAVRIAFALASYQRTLIPDDTPWDAFMAGQTNALTPDQIAGWQMFTSTARCNLCHPDPFFSDDLFHNVGLRPKQEDRGRGPVIQVPYEDGSFKTPSLRNAGLRRRLFHNGQSAALDDPSQLTDPASVLNVYLAGGGVDRSNLDPYMTVLTNYGITANDLLKVLDFVANGLTDPRAAQGLPPFDHPTLRSTAVPPPPVYGTGIAGTGGREPFLIDSVPTWPGNTAWHLGLAGGNGTGLAVLALGLQPLQPPVVAGLAWNVAPLHVEWFALTGPAGRPGVATWHLPLPNDPNLTTLPFYLQLFAQDPAAPLGVAASRGWELVVR